MPHPRLRSDYVVVSCCKLITSFYVVMEALVQEFSSAGLQQMADFPHREKFLRGTTSFALAQRRGMEATRYFETENRVGSEVVQTNTSEYLGPIKGYSVCPCRPGYSLLRVDAVVRTSQTTGHNGYTQTNSPFDFAGCIPRLPGRFFLIEIS